MAGTLRLGILPTIAPYLLPDAVRGLRKGFPRLSVPIENRRGALVVRPFAPPVPVRTLALVWRPGSPVAAVLKPLGAVLGESLRRVAARA